LTIAALMDPRLLEYYNQELTHIREMGAEFAEEFPKIAGRLGLEGFECADPYVERLLEGFAFLTARVQLRLDCEFPQFTQHLLEIAYPHYLAPIPSMAITRFFPAWNEGSLEEGYLIPRGESLRSIMGKGDQTACEYRTSQDVTLWPIEIEEAEYASRDSAAFELPPQLRDMRAVVRLRLRTRDGLKFSELPIDRLPLYLSGLEGAPMALYEQLLASSRALVVQSCEKKPTWRKLLPKSRIQPLGFDDDLAMLPYAAPSFRGYRLLQEYFAFHQRFMFVQFTELQQALHDCQEERIDIVVALQNVRERLDEQVDRSNFVLFCTPAVNLFSKAADRNHLNERDHEHHIVPDRTRPQDLEVYQVTKVTGYSENAEEPQVFEPFYSTHDAKDDETPAQAYFTVQRRPNVLSTKQQRFGTRSSYVGNEVFISLVDGQETPYRHDLKQLQPQILCTNRDLPLHMPVGLGRTDFSLSSGAPVESTRCVAGPTSPRPSLASSTGELLWRLVGNLSLNYLSLCDEDPRRGASALRDILRLYVDPDDQVMNKQVDGVRSVKTSPITRRLPIKGPTTFARGLEVLVTVDESQFEGSGPFLLGSVLAAFFAKYVSINSFTETALSTLEGAEIMRWPATIGNRQIL